MRASRRAVLPVLLVLFVFAPGDLTAQGAARDGRPFGKRLSVVVQLGPSVGGPAASLARQLREAGYDDPHPGGCLFGFCADPSPRPTKEGAGWYVGLEGRFAVTETVAAVAAYGNTALGGSMGYRAVPGSIFGESVHSHWDANSLWAGALWTPVPALRVGGGPAWYRLENLPMHVTVHRIGGAAEVGVDIPTGSRFFFDLTARLYVVPTRNVEHGRTESITLRPTWTHGSLVAGLGLRL